MCGVGLGVGVEPAQSSPRGAAAGRSFWGDPGADTAGTGSAGGRLNGLCGWTSLGASLVGRWFGVTYMLGAPPDQVENGRCDSGAPGRAPLGMRALTHHPAAQEGATVSPISQTPWRDQGICLCSWGAILLFGGTGMSSDTVRPFAEMGNGEPRPTGLSTGS